MTDTVRNIVIVGGGTAGWLSACMIAARANPEANPPVRITVIEAPDIPTVGVGEGTWPTMRSTLADIGLRETDFLRACDASFKQGSRFDGWVTGAAGDSYLHPFTPPPQGDARDLLATWDGIMPFAAMSAQAAVCDRDLAPRQNAMPDYAGALNYAYHFDAGKFAALLSRHAVENLGVRHVADRMTGIDARPDGDIAAVRTPGHGAIAGDLFIDCTGHRALLIGEHYGIERIGCADILFNDRAVAMQVPVAHDSAIASQTVGTAHAAGWLWDIGLPNRRGIGCVYASRFMEDDAARAVLDRYVAAKLPDADPASLQVRELRFDSGYRARFWHRNCIAIGLSAGFFEPLEASAIVMIELSLRQLTGCFPARRSMMELHACQFNSLFRYRWERIVEFLKLHYALSRREEPYWRAHRAPAAMPPRLPALLNAWRDRPPSIHDFPAREEIFPAESWQYVLYGMGFAPPGRDPLYRGDGGKTAARLMQEGQRARSLMAALPAHRAYLDAVRSIGTEEKSRS